MDKSHLTDEKLESIARKISQSSYEFIRKAIDRELKLLSKKGLVQSMDAASIIMMSISSITANILLTTEHFLSKNAGKKVGLELLMLNHVSSLKKLVDEEEWKSLKEKMN